MLKILSSVVNAFYDETGVVLLHGFENSFTVNKQKTLTRCVYLEWMINVSFMYKKIEFCIYWDSFLMWKPPRMSVPVRWVFLRAVLVVEYFYIDCTLFQEGQNSSSWFDKASAI